LLLFLFLFLDDLSGEVESGTALAVEVGINTHHLISLLLTGVRILAHSSRPFTECQHLGEIMLVDDEIVSVFGS